MVNAHFLRPAAVFLVLLSAAACGDGAEREEPASVGGPADTATMAATTPPPVAPIPIQCQKTDADFRNDRFTVASGQDAKRELPQPGKGGSAPRHVLRVHAPARDLAIKFAEKSDQTIELEIAVETADAISQNQVWGTIEMDAGHCGSVSGHTIYVQHATGGPIPLPTFPVGQQRVMAFLQGNSTYTLASPGPLGPIVPRRGEP